MTPEIWRQVEELYEEARALSPSARTALLERADPGLRATIAAMLARDDGGFLDRPAWEGRESLLKAESLVIVGQQLGPYQIEQKIGQGGMGEVFRATDTRLHRTVAIKTSFVQFTGRFEREARVIAALNHPHIAALYDVGSSPSGSGYLVLEYVEGLTLADQIARGPVEPHEARRIALETAEAIEAAHEKSIVHRDLKPANIKLGEGGTVKVLDFGLAKAIDEVQPMAPGEITNKRVILGTASYMSPEQALGGPTDRRSDIWSFGALVGEMVSGKRLFNGATTNDVLASVVRGEPDFSGVPDEWVPLIRRCLTKDVRRRLQSIGEARVMLEDGLSFPAAVAPVGRRASRSSVAVALALVSLGAITWTLIRARSPGQVAAFNASLLAPPETSFRFCRNGEGGFAVSPDGSTLAFVGRREGKAQLWVRSLEASESRLLPGSDGAYNPFWSPDSRWIAFFTPRNLKKIEVSTGAVTDLYVGPSSNLMGSWSPGGVIIMSVPLRLKGTGSRLGAHIERVPDAGGTPMPVPGTMGGYSPHFLPDGRRFVYVRRGERGGDLWLASLDPDEKPRRVGEVGEHPTLSAGHLLSVVNGILMAQPFDPARGEFTGESFPLKAPLASRVLFGLVYTDFSANTRGILVYPPLASSLTELRWRDRTGKQLGSLGAPGEYYTPRISPDGRQVAFTRRDGNSSDIWVANPNANSLTRLTFDPGIAENPVWSPDGAAVTFANDAAGIANLYRKAVTGAGTLERLTTNAAEQQPLDWSRDGRFLVYTQITAPSEMMIQAASGGQPVSFLGQHAHGAVHAQFNPGVPRWIAYDFDDSGRREVYVQSFEPGKPALSARWQISNSGGQMPRWRADGKEIFFLSLDGKMMAARVSSDGTAFQTSTPNFLFNAPPPNLRTPNWEYDVSADGERFLMIEPLVAPEFQPLTLVTNWRSR